MFQKCNFWNLSKALQNKKKFILWILPALINNNKTSNDDDKQSEQTSSNHVSEEDSVDLSSTLSEL